MIIEDAFAYIIAIEIMQSNDIKPRSIHECQCRTDWLKWKEITYVEFDYLAKRKVFGVLQPTPPNMKPVGYK